MLLDDQINRPITQQHEDLLVQARTVLAEWRSFIIGVDGRDGAGKSTTARFISWQMEVSHIEADLFLLLSDEPPAGYQCPKDHRLDWLKEVVGARLQLNRPVIVEGMFLLELLARIGYEPDFLVYVESSEFDGCSEWQDAYRSYETDFEPLRKADFVFKTP